MPEKTRKHSKPKSSKHMHISSKGWHAEAPSTKERKTMKKECGSKCFLGPIGESCFPICTKNTCEVNKKGVYAAYVRAREYGSTKMKRKSHTKHKLYGHKHSKKLYRRIASKAKTLLKKFGYGPNLK